LKRIGTHFKQRLGKAYPDLANSNRRLGSAAGNLWRFIHDMGEEDFVIVPDLREFYVAKVSGPARYEVHHTYDDTAHRRTVEWQNNGNQFHADAHLPVSNPE
jgi:predicted Mrr-cat superfamily restriction endonuclease